MPLDWHVDCSNHACSGWSHGRLRSSLYASCKHECTHVVRPSHAVIPVEPPLDMSAPRQWSIPCDEQLYSLGRPPVAQCTPATGASVNGTAMGCGRAIHDGFLDETEQVALVAMMERAMRGLFHQGAQTSFAPDARSALKHLGAAGHALYAHVSERVRATLEADYGLARIYPAGTLLTRIWADERIPADGMDVEPGRRYDNPHVDKANRASYDYSALLYLNSHCHDRLTGGHLSRGADPDHIEVVVDGRQRC